jgi:3'-phosphoadenosine 5'-phosphosulfate (PAPS) 3'-phosphatase
VLNAMRCSEIVCIFAQISIMISFVLKPAVSIGWKSSNSLRYKSSPYRACKAMLSMNSAQGVTEIAVYGGKDPEIINALNLLAKRREVNVVHNPSSNSQSNGDRIIWSAHRDNIQLDCTILEPMYLGKRRLDEAETSQMWDESLRNRAESLSTYTSLLKSSDRKQLTAADSSVQSALKNLGDGGKYQSELNAAIAAVQQASFMSRSMQRYLLKGQGSVSKGDKSPVTIADFAVQAMVLYSLNRAFPNDLFIAEEDSDLLREDEKIRAGVLSALRAATDIDWTEELLYSTIDKGTFEGVAERVWVLDPVDGTKGFMRGEHYCIALALMINGKPTVSAMGCPNLILKNVLEPEYVSKKDAANDASLGSKNPRAIPYVEEGMKYSVGSGSSSSSSNSDYWVHSPDSGSLFFAVLGRGAFARSLSMPLGAAFEVQVSGCPDAADGVMCEAAEAAHGDRGTTIRVSDTLKIKKDFIRLDGQCKYCVVGSGAAEGNVRLPPKGYQEKIWDHAAGVVFMNEAGGEVSDLTGKPLDFTKGRYLDASVAGVLSSNGALHTTFLNAVKEASRVEEEEVAAGRKPKRPDSMN